MYGNWHYRDTVLALCTTAIFVITVARLVISPVIPFITETLQVTNSQVGLAITGIWVFHSLAQFPSGIFADQFGEKPLILVSIGGTTIMSLLLAMAPVFPVFVLCAVLLGAVNGLHYSVATTFLSRLYDDIGTAVGIHGAGAPVAGLVAPAAAGWIGTQYGWRPAIALTAVAGIPVFTIFLFSVKSTEPLNPGQSTRKRFRPQYLLGLLSNQSIAIGVCFAILATFVLRALLTFLPTFLVTHHNKSAMIAAIIFSIFFLVNSVAQVGVGILSDRYSRNAGLAVCMIVAALGLILFVSGSGYLMLGVATVFVGIGMGFHPTLLPMFLEELPKAEQGGGFGLVRTIYGVFGSAGPVGAGVLADIFGWVISFMILTTLCLFVAGYSLYIDSLA
ncbi:MFS transporter [Natronorubrum sp. FCH18a]|uniref:MFS transporter n=1 Tax=Natronorubrum sp. FCH18a TaxID=3447018 RepID=UPI003F5196F1